MDSKRCVYTRIYVGKGTIRLREEIERDALKEKGLKSAEGLLIGLRGGAAKVIRAVVQTGETQHIQFGLPASMFDEPVPPYDAFVAKFPEQYFSVQNSDGDSLSLNLIVPATDLSNEFLSMIHLLVAVSGEPDPSEGPAAEVMKRTVYEIAASSPALVTVMLNHRGNDAAFADLVGFTEHFAAKLLLEKSQADSSRQSTAGASGAADTEIPFGKVTLEALAELNVRSCLILTGAASGSRPQAQAFDDWLESYRGSNDDVMKALLQPGRKLEADLSMMGKALWTELADGPSRFTSAYNATSCYFIPRNADPVPNITDYAPR